MVTIGKEKGYGDALRVEEIISKGIVKVVEVNVSRKSIELAKYVCIQSGNESNLLCLKKWCGSLLDDDVARSFARSLGVEVRGSLGLILEGLKNHIITYSEALEGLDKLSEIMYLSSDVYKEVLSKIKEFAKKVTKIGLKTFNLPRLKFLTKPS